MNIEQEIDILKRQMKSQRELSKHLSEFMDCLISPLHKRIWWWLGGFYFRKVGRWYSNKSGFYWLWYKLAKLIKCT